MTRTTTNLMIFGTVGLLGASAMGGIVPDEADLSNSDFNDFVDDVIAHQDQPSLDFNCDGVVGDQDLIALIGSGSFDINTFLELVGNWGQPAYDVNCDTLVNRADLFDVAEQTYSAAQAMIAGFESHWDETGTPYDLNCDGVVNGLDSMAMITSGNFNIVEYLALLDDLGQSPHEYDLNCDGTVGIVDFLAGLQNLTEGEG